MLPKYLNDCDQVILKSEKRDKKGRNTIKWIQPHIIKWMLRGGLRTAELITSTGVRRDVNNSVFVAGIKTDTRLDMEPREWTRSQATKTQLSPPRDGASNGQVPRPQISSTEHSGNLSVKTGARNVSTLRRQKSQQQTWKKSTCRDLRRCECDECPHCYWASVSDHPWGQNQPDQYCEILRHRTQTTFLREKRMTRVTLKTCLTPCSARAGHRVNTTLSFFWKNKLSLLLSRMACPVPSREDFLVEARSISLFWHFTKLTSLWLIEVLFKQRVVGK